SVAIIFGLAVIPVVGAVGAAVDYSRASAVRAGMQAAADAAAMYAAKGSYASDSDRITAGVSAFNASYQLQLAAASPTATIDNANGTVTVTAASSVPTPIFNVVGFRAMSVGATSVARIGGGSTACVLGLQPTNDAIFVHGSGGLTANCGLYSNSTSSNAI